MKGSGGTAAMSASNGATDERTFDQFLEEWEQRLDEGMYVAEFAG